MDPVTFVGEVLSRIESTVVSLGASPWLLLVVLLLCCVDGFLPPVPSESIVIAVATLSVMGEVPPLYLVALILSAALGAWWGDLIAYSIGSRVPLERLRLFRGPRGRAALAKAADSLDRRGSTILLSGRFIPVGRIALNMTAGAVGHPRERFVPIAAGAGLLWACYSTVMGIGAGHLLRDSPLAAMALGVAAGVLMGLVIDKLIGRARSMLASRRAAAEERLRLQPTSGAPERCSDTAPSRSTIERSPR
ncbi:DedA family protein [Glycomyces tenuis]|uniref:DedA family protein n=1 Tax=Glycomyces tenuis TaxID=58116 RepID=UPI00047B6CE7|nr:VTT domain-containing protein [Glycomyces tenuis]